MHYSHQWWVLELCALHLPEGQVLNAGSPPMNLFNPLRHMLNSELILRISFYSESCLLCNPS